MEDPISSSTFAEKDNKIEISSKNTKITPIFENIVDIKNHNQNIKESTSYNFTIKNKKMKINKRFCIKKIGHTLCLLSDKMGNPKIMIGPDWGFFISFCGCIVIGYLLFFWNFWKKLNLFYKIFGISSFSIYFISYSGTFLLNPGYPERNEDSLIGRPKIRYKYCNECEIYERVDRKISHCNICGVCIEGHDHHCPWTGKCIGRKTLCFFNTFLYSILVIILYFFLAFLHIEINNRN